MGSQNENMSPELTDVQNTVEFINKAVLKPDSRKLKGIAHPMVEHATGMMIQDLQSFMQGFEQVGLIAVAKIAQKAIDGGAPKTTLQENNQSHDTELKDIFEMVSNYGTQKANISKLLVNPEFIITKENKGDKDSESTVNNSIPEKPKSFIQRLLSCLIKP